MRERLYPYRRLVWAGLTFLFVVDVLEALPPLILKATLDLALAPNGLQFRDQLLQLAAAYLGVTVVQAIGRYGWRMYLIRASFLAGRDIRQTYANHLFSLPASFFDRSKIGDLMSVATNDVDAIRMAMGPGLLVLADAVILFVSTIIVMFWLSPQLALLSLLPLPFVPWIVMKNEKQIHSRFLDVQEAFGRLSALAQESLSGIRVVKAFAREHAQVERFDHAGLEYVRLNLQLSRVQSAFGPTLDFAMSIGMVLLLWIGGQWTLDQSVSIWTFVAFQRYIQKMIWPMAAFGMAINYYQRAVASSNRIEGLLAVKTDVPEPESPLYPKSFDHATKRTPGKIEFKDLCFRFPGTE
ncbi:MAG: ABC transporter transmembrane domain-containing protein, partial [Bdellovibrionota bacterium]